MGHTIDKLSNSSYSRSALIAGFAIMLFFMAFPNNQYAAAETLLQATNGKTYKLSDFFFIPEHLPFCDIPHWHAVAGPSGPTSTDGMSNLLPETMGECGYGATLPGMLTCDNPGEICIPSNGVCDIADICQPDGSCSDTFITQATTPCETGFDACQQDSFCNGSGPFCPAIEDAPDGTLCDNGDGGPTECSEQDTCMSGFCEDNDKSTSTECGGTPGECSEQRFCDGAGFCEDEQHKSSGTMCGDSSNSACDEADTCDGAGACQTNIVESGAACGDPTSNECNAADTCDGAGACLDNFVEQDVSCGDQSSSACDLPDACDGAGSCAQNFVLADLPCGDLTDTECNPLDLCDGAGTCVENIVESGGPCGDQSNTECNEADTCDGNGMCQDNFVSPEVACGDQNDSVCDGADTCDGAGACDQNIHVNDPCGDPTSDLCNLPDSCDDTGACNPNFVQAGLLCGDDFTDTVCNPADTCDGAGKCDIRKLAIGALCGDTADNECTSPDTCDFFGNCNENHNDPLFGICTFDTCQEGTCVNNVCVFSQNEPDGTVCNPSFDNCTEDDTCQGGNCAVGGPVDCSDGDSCTTDTCIPGPFGGCFHTPTFPLPPVCINDNPCIEPIGGGPVDCNDNNDCTVDMCDITQGCVNTPTISACDDEDSCTTNDMCDSSGACVGNTDNPSCLMIEPNPDNETFDLEYECVADNVVSITSATFTRDGESLEPSGLSFFCPPGIVVGGLEFAEIPNDFTADVTINGIEGDCVIEEGEDISAISFELIDGVVECFRGEGSDSILILTDPDDGEVIGAAVGGTFIPIDSTALVVAYAQNNLAWIIPLLMITAAIGFMKFGRSKSSENSI